VIIPKRRFSRRRLSDAEWAATLNEFGGDPLGGNYLLGSPTDEAARRNKPAPRMSEEEWTAYLDSPERATQIRAEDDALDRARAAKDPDEIKEAERVIRMRREREVELMPIAVAATTAIGAATAELQKTAVKADTAEIVSTALGKIATVAAKNTAKAITLATSVGLGSVVGVVAAAASSTGIGLPIVIGAAIAVAVISNAYRQKVELQIMLNEHFRQLLFMIKNYALVEQTLAQLEVDVPKIEPGKPVTFEKARVALSETFQNAVVEYTGLLKTLEPIRATKDRTYVGAFINTVATAFKTVKRFFGSGAIITQVSKLFATIERLYLMEISRFTSILFYNLENFQKIVGPIKASNVYLVFVNAQTMPPVNYCSSTETEGKDEVCSLPEHTMEQQLESSLLLVQTLVSPEQYRRGVELSTLLDKDVHEIVKDGIEELDDATNPAETKADAFETVIKVGRTLSKSPSQVKSTRRSQRKRRQRQTRRRRNRR